MNLKDFSSKYVKKVTDDVVEKVKNLEDEIKKENIDEYEEVKSMYDKYSDMNETELEKELIQMVNMQKANGTLDKQQMKSTYEMLKPMLNEAQRERLDHYMKLIL